MNIVPYANGIINLAKSMQIDKEALRNSAQQCAHTLETSFSNLPILKSYQGVKY